MQDPVGRATAETATTNLSPVDCLETDREDVLTSASHKVNI